MLQDDRFDATDSIMICAFTTDPQMLRCSGCAQSQVQKNGLKAPCNLMVDKITTVPKTKIGSRVGRLDDEDIVRLNRQFLSSWDCRAHKPIDNIDHFYGLPTRCANLRSGDADYSFNRFRT
jgi:mRNA interferase MazF